MLSPNEQRRWQDLVARFAEDQDSTVLTTRPGAARRVLLAWWTWGWIVVLAVAAVGMCLAVLGSKLDLPVIGIVGLATLLGGYLLMVEWLAGRAERRRRHRR